MKHPIFVPGYLRVVPADSLILRRMMDAPARKLITPSRKELVMVGSLGSMYVADSESAQMCTG